MQQWRLARRRWIRCLPLLLLGLCAPSFGAALIKLGADFTHTDLSNHVDLLVDPTHRLTIEQIAHGAASASFVPAKRTSFRIADSAHVYWLRFGIDNPLDKAQVVVLNLRTPDNIEVAAFDASLQALPVRREPLLQLLIPPKSRQLYYLQVRPGGLAASQLEVTSLDHYVDTGSAQSWFSGTLQGGILVVALLAAGVGMLRRDSACAWLIGYCLAIATVLSIFCDDPSGLLSGSTYWQYRHQLLQIGLLLGCLFGIGLALKLPIAAAASPGARALLALAACNALAIPVVAGWASNYAMMLTVALMLGTTGATVSIAIFSFLKSHRRELLLYALTRMTIFILTTGGAFAWATNSSLRTLTNFAVPVTMTLEIACLFAILLRRSFDNQRQRARDERDIAILEAEARSRTEVVAEVGHRVRTPISGVLGMLDMLQDTSLSATQLDYLNTIRRAGNELLNAVDEISDVSRLQAHAANLQQNIFDPHALVTECVDGFRSAAAAHHIELINDLAPELPPYVSGDLTRLRQILLQLLHQAVSQHERGEIVLRARPLSPDWLHFDIQTRAAIAATPPAEGDRANPPGSANVRFAIARQLIAMLSGRIQIDDLADGNLHAAFELELPTVERNTPSSRRDTTLQGKSLLVIDDSATFCDVIERQLSHWGMTIYKAHTASEGLARLRNQATLSQPIDALLIDAEIAELQQGEWAQRLRGEAIGAPIVILLSSQPNATPPSYGVDSRRVLPKPVNHTSLKITLIEAFKQRETRALPAAHKRNEPIRCLFAEDNAINAKVLAVMLDKLGVSYTVANNGQEAVDACRREHFDLVLMDWDMPVMDGWEASRRIREMYESRGLPQIPIIALTANTVEELGERARQLVTDAHLVKPIRLQSLRELLEQWTGKSTAPPSDPAH